MSEKKMAVISLRVPEWLRLKIEEAATAEETSMNSLINQRMSASFDQPALIDALAMRLCVAIDRAHGWTTWDAISEHATCAESVRNEDGEKKTTVYQRLGLA